MYITKKSFLRILQVAAFIFLTFFWSCKKNSNIGTPTSTSPPPTGPTTPGNPNPSPLVELVNTTVAGRVIDANKQPVSGATIKSPFASTTTDDNGQFILNNIQLDKYAGYIVAQKAGYFDGSKTFQLMAGSSNYVEIQLITRNESGRFSSSSGGDITIANGGSIKFPANSLVDPSTNDPYNGTAIVSAYYFDPTASEFENIIPGRLSGIAKDSSLKSLLSYGMIVTEITGGNGQKLQIASGKAAEITFPIPASLVSTAPAKIPLWYFDEVKGLWREVDSATINGNNYKASVSHFSVWNCDNPMAFINFRVTVRDKNSNPLSAVKITIRDASNEEILYNTDHTDANGLFGAAIPRNANLTLTVFDRCGNVAYSQNLKTGNNDLDLGTINVNLQSVPVTFSGTLIDCTGAGVIDGSVQILIDGFYTTAHIADGTFSVTVYRCYTTPTTAQIVGGDIQTRLIDTLTINNVTSLNVPSIQLRACNQSDQYFYYTLNGVSDTLTKADYIFSDYVDSRGIYLIEALGYNNAANFFRIYINDSSKLNTPITQILISITNYDSSYSGNSLTLTEIGEVNTGYITGNFTGQVLDGLHGYATVPVSGRFRIKRTK